jgi:hypothetical protein
MAQNSLYSLKRRKLKNERAKNQRQGGFVPELLKI